MRQFVYSTLHPAIYHGHGQQPPFFEGWYFKIVSADETQRYAIIPGVQSERRRPRLRAGAGRRHRPLGLPRLSSG